MIQSSPTTILSAISLPLQTQWESCFYPNRSSYSVHLTAHNLFPSSQSAYRKHHSTEISLLKVKNDILLNMNQQHIPLLTLLDLSSAFDIVDDTILLHRLHTYFGISDTSLSCFGSYLSGRQQYVSINWTWRPTRFLPRSSPLYTTSPFLDLIKSHLPEMHCYADYTQIYLSFKPDSLSSEVPHLVPSSLAYLTSLCGYFAPPPHQRCQNWISNHWH